jgi:hypothetical protein
LASEKSGVEDVYIFGYPIEEAVSEYFFHQNLYSCKIMNNIKSLGDALSTSLPPTCSSTGGVLAA